MQFFYSFSIHFYAFCIKLFSIFSYKAKLWYTGRKNIFLFLNEKCAEKENVIWFHCASLGEFEQGKPLMKKIKQQEKNSTLLVTFFSPSGYEIKKNDAIIDIVAYLPPDTRKNAKKFVQIVKPKKVFFVKYEFWFNYIQELAKANIPFYYVSAIFRENQYFFTNYGKWFLKQLNKCSFFFVQNENSKIVLEKHGINQVKVTGDTRFDRVYSIAHQDYTLDFITAFKKDKRLIVAGSTWMPDEKLLSKLFSKINSTYKLVIAPHVVEKNHITQIKNIFHSFSTVCFSEIETKNMADYEILIIDTIGLLSRIYKYADVSYIGGAFDTGLHNILEAAVFEKPVFFGPNFQKFNEAVELVARSGAFSVKNAHQMIRIISCFENTPQFYRNTCEICKDYVAQNLGATDKIISELYF